MSYNLKTCLEDVARKRGRLGNSTSSDATSDYHEVWDCMNRYTTACLASKKGINIANFCKIGYQQEKLSGDKVKMRPYFHLAEAFCKNYAIDNKKGTPVAEKELSVFEEFNFSKAAIKFSKSLAKDNVFCGLRYVIQSFGEAMSQGKQVVIDFECGRLTASDRRWKFAFKGEMYSRQGLPAPADSVKGISYDPSNSYIIPSTDAMKLKLSANRFGSQKQQNNNTQLQQRPVSPSEQSEMAFSENNFGDMIVPNGNGNQTPNINYEQMQQMAMQQQAMQQQAQQQQYDCPPYQAPAQPGDMESEMSGSGSELSDVSVYDPALYKGPTVKQEQANREAMDRYLTEMEIRASEAIADRRQWEDHLDRCLNQERNDLDRKRALCAENSDFILQQMEWNRVKKNHDRRNFVASASAHEFPQFTEPDDAGLRKVMKERQRQMREELDLQVRTNNALKTIERNKERELEYAQLVANKNELIVQERKECKAKDFEKTTLCDSWGRDVRMRNIFKAIDNHTNAANTNGSDIAFDDNASQCSSRGGFSTRNRQPKMGASMSLEQQRAKNGKK